MEQTSCNSQPSKQFVDFIYIFNVFSMTQQTLILLKNVEASLITFFEILPKSLTNQNYWGCKVRLNPLLLHHRTC